MLPNGLVQLFSDHILGVTDNLDQHKLQPKKAALDNTLVFLRSL